MSGWRVCRRVDAAAVCVWIELLVASLWDWGPECCEAAQGQRQHHREDQTRPQHWAALQTDGEHNAKRWHSAVSGSYLQHVAAIATVMQTEDSVSSKYEFAAPFSAEFNEI